MPLLNEILRHFVNIRKPQRTFLTAFIATLFCYFGRATRTNIARQGGPSERAQARWEQRPLDFTALTLKALEIEGVMDHPMAAVLDASFLAKSGEYTWGLGKFWNGCHSRVETGLEISTLGLVDLKEGTAYALDTRQTPATQSEEESRMDTYLQQVLEKRHCLPKQVTHLLVDGGYTKRGFIDGVVNTGLHIVGKLRKDADLWYRHTPVPEKRRGRPKKFDGKVWYDDLSRWEQCPDSETGDARWTQTLWHKSLHRDVKVVLIRYKPGQHALLFSTDLTLGVDDICRMYKLRFQIEFLFRDGKQYTGLGESQMRSEEGQDFHINAALLALNLMRLEERRQGRKVYSLGSAKKRNYNEKVIRLIFNELGLNVESPENQEVMRKVRSYGAMAA